MADLKLDPVEQMLINIAKNQVSILEMLNRLAKNTSPDNYHMVINTDTSNVAEDIYKQVGTYLQKISEQVNTRQFIRPFNP